MGIVNAGQLAVYEDIEPELLERVEDVIFDRRPDATERLVEYASTVDGRGDEARARPLLARGAGRRSGSRTRSCTASSTSSRRTPRRRAQSRCAAARRDRGAADGRDEDRRRPLRRREDVPAAGREERARDEARRRVPRAVHGGGEDGARPRAARIVLATVKGDVHDIGKNIVGVVLGCNSYEVIDLGVMVPADRILDTAVEQGCDIVGLSGLITPSLDEMVSVAKEMERRGLELPLLIGGATTSKQHTAVRIAPEYAQPTVHVLDASRVVGVVGDLLDADRRRAARRARTARSRSGCASCTPRRGASRCSRSRGARAAHAHRLARRRPRRAAVHGRAARRGGRRDAPRLHRLDVLLPRVGAEGQLPGDPRRSREGRGRARSLRRRAASSSTRSSRDGSLQARGVYGFWPASAEGDDVVLDGGTRFPMLRQQADHGDSRPNRSLADFVAPRRPGSPTTSARSRSPSTAPRSSPTGSRPSTTTTARSWSGRSPTASPRRSPSGCTRVRGASGTRPDERARERGADRRAASAGSGPRSAIPACPDHSEKGTLLALLDAERAGVGLTETLRDDARRRASAGSTSATRRPATSRSAGSGATRSRTTRSGRGSSSRRPSAGCGQNLAYEP